MEIVWFTRTGRYLPDTHQYTHGQRTSQEASKSRRKPKSTQLATGLLRTLQPPGQTAAAAGCRAEPHLRISAQLTGLADQPDERTPDAPARARAVSCHPRRPAGPAARHPGPRAARGCIRAVRRRAGGLNGTPSSTRAASQADPPSRGSATPGRRVAGPTRPDREHPARAPAWRSRSRLMW
jgi:hypothetical protein